MCDYSTYLILSEYISIRLVTVVSNVHLRIVCLIKIILVARHERNQRYITAMAVIKDVQKLLKFALKY